MVGDQLPPGPKCHLRLMPTQAVPASRNPFFLCIYLLMAVLGLHCCSGISLAAASEDYFPIVVRGLLFVAASLVAEQYTGFRSRRTRTQQLRLLDSRAQAQYWWCMNLVTPQHTGSSWTKDQTCVSSLAGRFFTTEPPRKPL